jgi:hypothetical protein
MQAAKELQHSIAMSLFYAGGSGFGTFPPPRVLDSDFRQRAAAWHAWLQAHVLEPLQELHRQHGGPIADPHGPDGRFSAEAEQLRRPWTKEQYEAEARSCGLHLENLAPLDCAKLREDAIANAETPANREYLAAIKSRGAMIENAVRPVMDDLRLFIDLFPERDFPPQDWHDWPDRMRSLIERFIRLWDDALWHEPIRQHVLPGKIREARQRLDEEVAWIADSDMPGKNDHVADLRAACDARLKTLTLCPDPGATVGSVVTDLLTAEKVQHGRIARAFPALGWIDPTASDYRPPASGGISDAEQRAIIAGSLPRHGMHPMCIALARGDVFDRDSRLMNCTDEQRQEVQRIAKAALNGRHQDVARVPAEEVFGREVGMNVAFGVAAFDVLWRTEKAKVSAIGKVVMAGQEIEVAWVDTPTTAGAVTSPQKMSVDPLPFADLISGNQLTGMVVATAVLAQLLKKPDKNWSFSELAEATGKTRPNVTNAVKVKLVPKQLAEGVKVAEASGKDDGTRWKLGPAAWPR